MKYKIRKDIPIPERKTGVSREYMDLYETISEMEVGDCFDIPKEELGTEPKKAMNRLTYIARVLTKDKNQHFRVGSMLLDSGDLRVWRIYGKIPASGQ